MKLSARTHVFIGCVCLAAGALLAPAALATVRMDAATLLRGAVLAVFLAGGWMYPVVMSRGDQSESLQLDEGILVVLLLTVPGPLTIVAFALATTVAQVYRRRPVAKSAFNVGQIVLTTSAAVATTGWINPGGSTHSPVEVLAVCGGALVFFILNTAALAGVMATMGTRFRESALDGIRVHGMLVFAGVVLGLPLGLALEADPWVLPGVALPFLVLRQVLAGHFQARHDHDRISGLLESAVEINRSMRSSDVEVTVLRAARQLLRSREATILAGTPAEDALAVPMIDGDDQWLTVSGRPPLEPFDDTDRGLLATLAAVGSGALRNAALFEETRVQREQLQSLTSSLGEAVLAVDGFGVVDFVNPAAAHMLGVRKGVVAPYALLLAGERAMEGGVTLRQDDTVVPARDGVMLPVALTASPVFRDGAVSGAVLVLRDITERKAFEEELARHAFEDTLTGLPNRRLFMDRLCVALARTERSGGRHTLLFLDVDRFKTVNDSLGHQAGDELLARIAQRLRHVVRGGDTVARLGGDEFVVLVEDIADEDDARTVAEQLNQELDLPIGLEGGREVYVRASIGIALSTPGQSADDLLRDADVAMYQAKRSGTGRREVYDVTAMGGRSAERLDLEAALRRAVDRGELEAYFQPIISTADTAIIGAEALVRWNHPERGLLAPSAFIGLAEETGLILPIGEIVLEQACRQAQEWARRGLDLSVHVNLSARQFAQRDLVGKVASVLGATGLAPDHLFLEIVETLAMEDAERTTDIIRRLKEHGARFAIDDFGTGYSSLNYLKRFPVDEVKIDRSFVSGLGSDHADTAIVHSVISLLDALGMNAVAEGVETWAQFHHLRDVGCGAVQGFLFAPPVCAETFDALLAVPELVA